MSDKKPVTPVTLTVSFDVDQISSQLDWNFGPGAEPVSGSHSGAVFFEKGGKVELEVKGYGSKASGYTSFQIIDCCIITRPEIVQIGAAPLPTLYAMPSPFLQSIGAVHKMQLDFDSSESPGPHKDSPLCVTQRWEHHLDVIESPGRWDLSFIITVRVVRALGQVTATRVFYFDPESQVGDGSGGK